MSNQFKLAEIRFLKLTTLLLTGLLVSSITAQAQVEEEIDVVSEYKPKLTEARKLNVRPTNPDINFDKPELSYKNKPAYLPIAPSKKRLPAVSLGQQELDPLRNSFFKGGYGNYANVFAELNYNTLRDKNKAFSAYAKHHSGNGPVNNSDFSEQVLDLSAKKLYDNSSLSGEVYFKNNIVHNYGYNRDSSDFQAEDLRTRYTKYGLNASFDNERGDTGNIQYWLDVGAHNLSTSQNSAETDLFAKGKIKENINENAAIFDAKYRYLDYRLGNNGYSRSIFKINGHYQLNHEIGQAKIGFRSATVSDTSQSPFYFYPFIRVNLPLISNQLSAFGGIKGNLDVNTYQDFINENPYVKRNLPLQNTNKQLEIFAGVKGNFQQDAQYNAKIAYKNVENLPFFVNDSTLNREFDIRYNNGVAAIFELSTSFRYQISERWNASLMGKYRNFNLTEKESPWHIPALEYEVESQYKIGDKITIRASLFGFNQRDFLSYSMDGSPQTEQLDGILDLNAGIDYRFSKAFTAYFEFNNILGNEYQYWNNYPVRGFHLTGGLKLNLY